MRICLICTEKLPVPPIRGGAIQQYIAAVAPRLSRAHAVTVICRSDPALPAEEMLAAVRIVRLPAGDQGVYFRNVAVWLSEQPVFQLVVLFNRPAFAVQIAGAARGARLALSMHNDMFEPDRLTRSAGQAVLDRTDRVVCISAYVRRNIERLYPTYSHKFRTVYSGVDTVRYGPVWAKLKERMLVRQRLGLKPGDLVVLHVSRFSPRKGNRLLLDAMAQALPLCPQAKLLVVGSSRYGTNELDDYGQSFRRDAMERLNGAAVFTGFVPPADVAELYLAGDLFVVTSQWQEPLARVHYEAMAAGLPIVTTDRGGNCEVIEEGKSALVARPHDDPAAFADHIARLLEEPELRDRLGRRGRELAEERYTWDRVAGELLAIFARR
ncbi:MAG TPA: glycosyltransferase family 4 protein [Symbiobacteriaceae bacterium]